MIALRQQLLPAGDREHNIPCDLKDTAWFGKIDASGGAVFFASGVFYYFLTQEVRELVRGMADAFPEGVLVFDAANRTAVKMIAKTWLKDCKNQGCGGIFCGFGCRQGNRHVGQPSAGHKSRLYAGLQRFEGPFCQRLFPVSRKGR